MCLDKESTMTELETSIYKLSEQFKDPYNSPNLYHDTLNLLWEERNHNSNVINDLKSEVESLMLELENIKSVYNIQKSSYKCPDGIMHEAVYNQAAFQMITKYKSKVKEKMLLSHMKDYSKTMSESNQKGFKIAIRELKKYLKGY